MGDKNAPSVDPLLPRATLATLHGNHRPLASRLIPCYHVFIKQMLCH